MQTHPKTKLEIIVEEPIVEQLIGRLGALGVKGYTIMPAVGGMGLEGSWTEGQITRAQHMRMVVTIVDESLADTIMEDVLPLVARYDGIVYKSAVDVARGERF